MDKAAFSLELERLRQRYAEDLPALAREVEAAWEGCKQAVRDGRSDLAGLVEVHRLAHSLNGSGGTFGFREVSSAARAVHQLLDPVVRGEKPLDPVDLPELDGLISTLLHTVPRPDRVPAPVPGYCALDDGLAPVCVIGRDAAAVGAIANQLGDFGYDTDRKVRLAELPDRLAKGGCAAILLVADGPELSAQDGLGGQTELAACPPLFVIANSGDFASRLAAAKAGASGYFMRPLDMPALIDRLDALIHRADMDPFRILIVDDDPAGAASSRAVLETRGWICRVATDPSAVLGVLEEFRPDVILLDLYMPGVSGAELARVIRQFEEYAAIPIVYLSSEENLGAQLRAMSPGADYFLHKGVRPEYLASVVESRIRRYRIIRGLMTRDSLTGLLNHTSLMMRLRAEADRARRTGSLMAFAMIDLDRFKRINDAYGHPTGDKVLKTLAGMLRQRLRRTDVIGRYGGEEFGVILLDLDNRMDALRILDEVRVRFAEIRHSGPEGDFTVTFSAGLAFPVAGRDAEELAASADAALYEAKDGGRNRVVTASADAALVGM